MQSQKLTQFRAQLYAALPRRADATMDLLDALCSNTFARTPVELSLVPAFRRRWPSVHDAVDAFFTPRDVKQEEAERAAFEQRLRRVVAPVIAPPQTKPYRLFSVDALSLSRPSAKTLEDRSYVHQSGTVAGQQPVTVGHAYSLVMAEPERAAGAPPWVVPLSARRIPWEYTPQQLAAKQVKAVVDDPALPWYRQLCVVVADSHYSVATFLEPLAACPTLVSVTRLRKNRVLYHQPPPAQAGRRGAPKKYGAAFRLKQPGTWGEPTSTTTIEVLRGKRTLTMTIRMWSDLILKHASGGKADAQTVNVVQVSARDADGNWVYNNDLWLAVAGARRGEIGAEEGYRAYGRRFDQEHGHRFMRQRLLFDASQTPVAEHEENWISIVTLAYAQLYAARDLAGDLPRPWERRQPLDRPAAVASPTMVQRDFARILATTGTPAVAPQPRGKSPGRTSGQSPGLRTRRPVLKKGQQAA